ncbi:MAG: penicillin-binding protein 2 [Buchananella hordeovulneris]|nr:penicillin-binding protein 2 [Buchananella hordeovulneris]
MVFVVTAGLLRAQVVLRSEFNDLATQYRSEYEVDFAPRGDIVDASGAVLATSVERVNVKADLSRLANNIVCERQLNPETGKLERVVTIDENGKEDTCNEIGYGAHGAAKVLAPLLDRDPLELGAELAGDSQGYVVATEILPTKWREIQEWNIEGLVRENVYIREYPYGRVGSTVTGYAANQEAGKPVQGLTGIELTQNEYLTGQDGKYSYERSATGLHIPGSRMDVIAEPRKGQTVHTSIISDLQLVAQDAVDSTVAKFQADWGTAVVQEVATGRVLALADSNSFDPNAPAEKWANATLDSRAVTSPVEPGSTGKIATFAAALDSGAITPTTPVTAPYYFVTPSGEAFSDADEHEVMPYTAAGVLAASSNTGTVQVGDMVEDSVREKYLRDFGFGAPTGIELPGESGGWLSPAKEWDGRQRYTIMFGQGYSGTILQTNAMVAAVGGGGIYRAPRLVDGYTDADGLYTAAEHPEPRQVMQEKHAKELLTMLESVASKEGTGYAGVVEGYRTAGKTGTTQIFGDNGQVDGTVASFTGLLPANAPVVAISVVIYHPRKDIWGSTVAAPVFKTIGAAAMRILEQRPTAVPFKPYPLRTDVPVQEEGN